MYKGNRISHLRLWDTRWDSH